MAARGLEFSPRPSCHVHLGWPKHKRSRTVSLSNSGTDDVDPTVLKRVCLGSLDSVPEDLEMTATLSRMRRVGAVFSLPSFEKEHAANEPGGARHPDT